MIEAIINLPIAIFDGNHAKPENCNLSIGSVTFYTSRAPGKKTANEDTLAIIPVSNDSAVLAVADGLGGLPAGEEASRIVINELIKSVKKAINGEIHIRGAILDGIEHANKKIIDLKNGSATTLAVAELKNNTVRTYHAGDSLIMIMSSRGKIKYSAIPHSPTGYALESGMIDESEAMQHEEKHLISNCIGSQDLRVEIGPTVEMAVRDTLILASDGLSDNLYDGEIVEASRKGPLTKAARKLIRESHEHMEYPRDDRMCHPDDMTFIMYRPVKFH